MSTTESRVRAAYSRIEATDRPEIWIDLRPRADVEAEARGLDERLARGERLPLAGRLLAVKGNIDVAGLPTTAGCPAYAGPPRTPPWSPASARPARWCWAPRTWTSSRPAWWAPAPPTARSGAPSTRRG